MEKRKAVLSEVMDRTADNRVFFIANIKRKNPATLWLSDFSMAEAVDSNTIARNKLDSVGN